MPQHKSYNQYKQLSQCLSSKNNVPVVGKEEVRKSRDMHWLRIDRYFSSDMTKEIAEDQEIGSVSKYKAMEIPSENPDVSFQPVMCQHCNHAPCETVCPVAATTHSAEGLNHMTYNRCVVAATGQTVSQGAWLQC
jgi:molybdopterin-containing oxidoreductase family iron-sulfur binding subunit